MKEILITILREKDASPQDYREATEKLGYILASEASDMLEKETTQIETPRYIPPDSNTNILSSSSLSSGRVSPSCILF